MARRGTVPLARALSKLGVLSRARAVAAIAEGRVRVNGRVASDPLEAVVPETARLSVDGRPATRRQWRTILLHKPRGVLTTRHDPEGRPTVFDLLGDDGDGLVAVGRLDRATTGLLLLTADTRLADWLTDPRYGVTRRYLVTVRGRVTEADAAALMAGVVDEGERLTAKAVVVRKASGRESHLTIDLGEGRNREVRRLCSAIGHEVTALKRVAFGGLDLGDLRPGEWREVPRAELRAACPGVSVGDGSRDSTTTSPRARRPSRA